MVLRSLVTIRMAERKNPISLTGIISRFSRGKKISKRKDLIDAVINGQLGDVILELYVWDANVGSEAESRHGQTTYKCRFDGEDFELTTGERSYYEDLKGETSLDPLMLFSSKVYRGWPNKETIVNEMLRAELLPLVMLDAMGTLQGIHRYDKPPSHLDESVRPRVYHIEGNEFLEALPVPPPLPETQIVLNSCK